VWSFTAALNLLFFKRIPCSLIPLMTSSVPSHDASSDPSHDAISGCHRWCYWHHVFYWWHHNALTYLVKSFTIADALQRLITAVVEKDYQCFLGTTDQIPVCRSADNWTVKMAQREHIDGNIDEDVIQFDDVHQLRFINMRPDYLILALIREDDRRTLPEIHIPRLNPPMPRFYLGLVIRSVRELLQYSLTPGPEYNPLLSMLAWNADHWSVTFHASGDSLTAAFYPVHINPQLMHWWWTAWTFSAGPQQWDQIWSIQNTFWPKPWQSWWDETGH